MAPGQRLAQIAAEAAGAPSTADALQRVRELRRELDEFERRLVAQALAEGLSFAAIARDLGLSRQAVHRRFRDLSSREPPLLTAPAVRRVLRYAREAAAGVGTSDLGSEHVLIGVLRAADLPAAAMLRDAGVTLERVEGQVGRAQPRPRLFQRSGAGSGDLHALLAAPVHEARRRGDARIEVEHLLIAMIEDPASGASRILRALSVDPRELRGRLAALLQAGPGGPAVARPGRRPGRPAGDG